MDDGTAFIPLIFRNGQLVLYDQYYNDERQSKINQTNPNLKKDRRAEKKKGINNCGVALAATRNIKMELDKRTKQLVTHPNYSKICKFHEINFINYPGDIVILPFIELFITFDGAESGNSRAGNDRTQVHLLFGGLHKYFAGLVMLIIVHMHYYSKY